MKRKVMPILAALACLAGPAPARTNPDPDQICIYFEESGSNCLQAPASPIVSAFLVLENISEPSGIYGWACSIEVTPGVFVLAWICIGACPSGVWTPPHFAVGLQEPLPWAPRIPVLEMQILVIAPDPIFIWIHPYSPPGLPPMDTPGYVSGDDPATVVPLNNCTGFGPDGEPNPAGCINCDCEEVIGNEEGTWGTLKALYR